MKVHLALEHDGMAIGSLHLVLYNDQVPRTVKNFVGLLPKYKGSSFHRIIAGFMAQGGDFLNGDGTGTASIYDGDSFDDEALHLKHSRVGTLSMANSGPNTNGSQFFVTFRPTPHLNGKHVVFGHVDLAKSATVLDALESVPVSAANDKPKRPVVIVDYGLVVDNKENDAMEPAFTTTTTTSTTKSTPTPSQPGGTAAVTLDSAEINLEGDDGRETDQGDTGVVINETSAEDKQDDRVIEESNQPLSAKDKIKLRMRSLKQKINQARQLNKQAVKEEGERLSESDRDRKRQESKKDKAAKEAAWNIAHQKTLELAKAAGVDAKMLAQPAAESLSIAKKQAAKAKLNEYHVDDYHNPEGQYRNYERNIRSVRHNVTESDESTYNPLDAASLTTNSNGDQDGAHLVAAELQRRYEKSQKRDLKRKDKQDVEGSYINKRNKHFNKKISRTYDEATAEIKQNLERGTAL